MNAELKVALEESNLPKKTKTALVKAINKDDFRASLNIALIEKLFKDRAKSKTPNFKQHGVLNYIYDEKVYAKECTQILRKMKE